MKLRNQIIIIHKEKGMTSRDVVNIASKQLKIKKIGHTGTLDPIAEGVLVLLTGKYTKLSEKFMAKEKEYIATVQMGILTDTLDTTGKIIEENEKRITKEELIKLFSTFPKTYDQEVPIYSAVKVKGKKLYQYARKGEEVLLPKKKVEINCLKLLSFDKDTFTFQTTVSKGTYIRSLIRDLGEKSGVLFTMKELIRTRQGIFSLKDAIFLNELDTTYQGPMLEQVLNIPVEIASSSIKPWILNGRILENPKNYTSVLFLSEDRTPLAIYKKDQDKLRVDVMLGGESDETNCANK